MAKLILLSSRKRLTTEGPFAVVSGKQHVAIGRKRLTAKYLFAESTSICREF
jgi:hypothetical protein